MCDEQEASIKEICLSLVCGLNWVNEVLSIEILKCGMDLVKLFRMPPANLHLKKYYPRCFESAKMFNVNDTEDRAQLLYAPVMVRNGV